jgi:hypothetical protein
MDPGTPLTDLRLSATSVADDLGFVALADLSRALHASPPADYRIIGGHMMTALVARWELGADLYRQTGDADLGVSPRVIQSLGLVDRLLGLGYEQVDGSRFTRQVTDLPVRLAGDGTTNPSAVVDVLIPAYTSRARQNRHVGESLVTTEVPGLATALLRPAVTITLHLRRLDGSILEADLSFPDEVAALVLKALATKVRFKDTDVVDLWRCLEVCLATGIGPADFADGEPATATTIVRALFADRHGPGMMSLTAQQKLSAAGADQRHTRLQALITRVLGAP